MWSHYSVVLLVRLLKETLLEEVAYLLSETFCSNRTDSLCHFPNVDYHALILLWICFSSVAMMQQHTALSLEFQFLIREALEVVTGGLPLCIKTGIFLIH